MSPSHESKGALEFIGLGTELRGNSPVWNAEHGLLDSLAFRGVSGVSLSCSKHATPQTSPLRQADGNRHYGGASGGEQRGPSGDSPVQRLPRRSCSGAAGAQSRVDLDDVVAELHEVRQRHRILEGLVITVMDEVALVLARVDGQTDTPRFHRRSHCSSRGTGGDPGTASELRDLTGCLLAPDASPLRPNYTGNGQASGGEGNGGERPWQVPGGGRRSESRSPEGRHGSGADEPEGRHARRETWKGDMPEGRHDTPEGRRGSGADEQGSRAGEGEGIASRLGAQGTISGSETDPHFILPAARSASLVLAKRFQVWRIGSTTMLPSD